MLEHKKRKIAHIRHFLSQISALRELGALEPRLGKSLNGEIKKHNLYDSKYRMVELTALWKRYGNDIDEVLTQQLNTLEGEAKELSVTIDRAMEILRTNGRLPSVNALIADLGFENKNKSYKDQLGWHLRKLAEEAMPSVTFHSPQGAELGRKLAMHFSDPNFGRVSKVQVEEKIRQSGFVVTQRELREFWLFLNQQERASKISTSFSMSAQESEAIDQIARALSVSKSNAVSILIRGTLYLMASQDVNAIGFLEQSKKLSSYELNFISKFFSKVSI